MGKPPGIRDTSLNQTFPMAEHITLSPEMPVSALLTAYPQASRLFIQFRMACVGCPVNHLCTLGDLPGYYDLDWTNFWIGVDQILKNSS